MSHRWFLLWFFLLASSAWSNEVVRQVQEELRKRNLYFGDVDGQSSADLANALKRYQTRKGFAATGEIDEETATSLNVSGNLPPRRWPDIPVLRSDIASQLPPSQRRALEQQAEANPLATPYPAPPAESPPPAQDITPERITRLVQKYLRDGETSDVVAQTRYFSYPLVYFDHGSVTSSFVQKDVTNYVKRWPERKYVLSEPVHFMAAANESETRVEFLISFSVRNRNLAVNGRTRNFWTVRPEGDELKIVAIREERLRE